MPFSHFRGGLSRLYTVAAGLSRQSSCPPPAPFVCLGRSYSAHGDTEAPRDILLLWRLCVLCGEILEWSCSVSLRVAALAVMT